MVELRETPMCALLLALALSGCDGASGSDDAAERESDASPVTAQAGASDDGGRDLDGGGSLDARTPRDEEASMAWDAGASRQDAAMAGRTLSDGGAAAPSERDAGGDLTRSADAQAAQSEDAAAPLDAAPLDAGPREADAQPIEPEASGSEARDASEATEDAALPACVEQGARCETASCCSGVCVRVDDGALCASACELPTRCEGCGPYCGASRSGATRCDDAVLIAEDGTYLGEAASGVIERDSVCNESGAYGSSFGRFSIFNPNGLYGNSSGRHSPYNIYSISPPAIACRGSDEIIAHVSKSSAQARTVVDPDELCAWLRQRGM